MTTEDKIVAAIDRNTEKLEGIKSRLWWIALMLVNIWIASLGAGCPKAKAAPLLTAAPEPPALQHWHTTYVPTDSGVYPLEVFAPVLPRVEFQRTSEPMVNTPEPGTLTVSGLSILGMMFLNLLLLNKSSKIVELTKALREANERNARYYDALKQIEDYGGFAPTVVIARKALEENWK